MNKGKRLKKNLKKKSGLTGNRSLTFAMTEHNALSIEVTYDSFEEVTKKNDSLVYYIIYIR